MTTCILDGHEGFFKSGFLIQVLWLSGGLRGGSKEHTDDDSKSDAVHYQELVESNMQIGLPFKLTTAVMRMADGGAVDACAYFVT